MGVVNASPFFFSKTNMESVSSPQAANDEVESPPGDSWVCPILLWSLGFVETPSRFWRLIIFLPINARNSFRPVFFFCSEVSGFLGTWKSQGDPRTWPLVSRKKSFRSYTGRGPHFFFLPFKLSCVDRRCWKSPFL